MPNLSNATRLLCGGEGLTPTGAKPRDREDADIVPFTKYNQIYMRDERLEWINELYKSTIGQQSKGFALTVVAKADESERGV